ncbi:MAG: 1-acyl-sn-glycerol-3-phosphate acyltransferase [Verrucomicrobia bacterium]|nr:1-acyl-sn-glycerol-3-phosphate acyltransferase [Verrucomicrobiota bacterium]
MLYFLCRQLTLILFQLFCRVHVLFLEKPPKKGALIVASNHISHFDPPLLSAFFPRPLTWVAMEELFSHAWAARFFSWLGVISIDRFGKKSGSNRNALKKMRTALAVGKVLGIFPEGGIRSGATSILERAPLKPGLASLSFSNQTPIIPCVLLGSDRLYCKHAWFRRTPLWMIVGKGIIPPPLDVTNREKALHDFEKKLATVFPALQQELRERFQLCDDDLPKTAQERIHHKDHKAATPHTGNTKRFFL